MDTYNNHYIGLCHLYSDELVYGAKTWKKYLENMKKVITSNVKNW